MKTAALHGTVPFRWPTEGSRSHPLMSHVSRKPAVQTPETPLLAPVSDAIHSGRPLIHVNVNGITCNCFGHELRSNSNP